MSTVAVIFRQLVWGEGEVNLLEKKPLIHGHTSQQHCYIAGRPRQDAEVKRLNKDGTGGRGGWRETCQTVAKTQDVSWQVLGRNLKDWEMVTTLSLPEWRPWSPEELLPAGNLLEEDACASPQGCYPAGLLGTEAEAYGDAELWEAKATLVQHAQRRGTRSAGTHARFCTFISLPLSNCSSSGAIASQFLRGSFDNFRQMKATDTKSGHLLWVKEKTLGCIVSNYDRFYPSRKISTNNWKTHKYKFLNSSRL